MHMAAFDSRMLKVERGSPVGGEPWTKQLHHMGYFHDSPERGHLAVVPPCDARRPLMLNDKMGNDVANLGQYVEAAAALYSAYEGSEQGSDAPSGGPSAGGPTTGMPMPGSTATAVSPTFQTQISPQISPVFSQMQASPGATQAATTTQYQPGGMSAEGGGAVAAPAPMSPYGPSFPDFGSTGPTKYGGLPVSALDPVQFTDIREFPTAGSLIRDIRESEPFNWTPVYWLGGAALVGVMALAFMKQRKAA